jgi:hypothetical protein
MVQNRSGLGIDRQSIVLLLVVTVLGVALIGVVLWVGLR